MAIVQYEEIKIDNVVDIEVRYGLQSNREFHDCYILSCFLSNGERVFIDLNDSEFLRFSVEGNVGSLWSYSNNVTIFGNVNRLFSANVAVVDGLVQSISCNKVIQSAKKSISYVKRKKNVVTVQGDLHDLDIDRFRGHGDIIAHGCCNNVVVQNTVNVKGNVGFLETSKCTFCIK